MPTFHFQPSARLQKFLGRELIADPNLAVAEFIKNSYDAGASQVYLDFLVASRNRAEHCLIISDNGVGMTKEDFERDWMHPGFSRKALPNARVPGKELSRIRVPIGEKGLGRLAAGRLGNRLEVFTRKRVQEPWLHVMFDWNAFDDMTKALNKVSIPYDQRTGPISPRFLTGTILRICDLTMDWSGSIPGRKVPGRADTRLGRLRQDLEILADPLSPASGQFQITMASDSDSVQKFVGPIDASGTGSADYVYKFSLTAVTDGVLVSREIKRSERIQAITGQEAVTEDAITVSSDAANSAATEQRPVTLRSGPFTGYFYYSPLVAKRASELGIQPGVFLYRDGIRVDPYGHWDDDWLSVRARKASRQGYAPIQPNTLHGRVEISKGNNPELIDMSNRQGLVENDAFSDFLAHTREEFRSFDSLVLEEFVKPGWEQLATKAQRAAQRAQGHSTALLRSLVHTIRQPVFGLGADIESLRALVLDGRLAEPARTELAQIIDRAASHLKDIDEAVRVFLSLDLDSEIEIASLEELLRESAERVQPLATSLNIAVAITVSRDRLLAVTRDLFVRALAEVIRNAIQASRPQDRKPGWVRISTRLEGSVCIIDISDNGSGIAPEVSEDLFRNPVSTQARPGVGLLDVKSLLAVFRATISLASTGPDGTTFSITVPTAAELRKET